MIQKVNLTWIYSPTRICPYYLDPKQIYSYNKIKEDLEKIKKELLLNLNRSTDETEKRIIQTNIDEIDRLIRLNAGK